MTQNLPDTQDISETVISQDVCVERWGMLYSTNKCFNTLTLSKSEYTIGRAYGCDVVLTSKELAENVLSVISKVHFKIVKENIVVYLEDCSYNGTFVNNEKVGRGNRVLLQNKDEISLALPNYKVFVFGDSNAPEESIYPEEVRKRFVVSSSLGSGAWGQVNLVIEKRTFEKFAMKSVKKFSCDLLNDDGLMNEVRILKALKHPCVIQVHDIIDSREKLFIILELMEGGNLFNRILLRKQLPESEACWLFCQIVAAVEYLHSQSIAHRDLKPENILLSSSCGDAIVKLTDFGLSSFFSSQTIMKTLCGTPMYVAPEVIETKGCGFYTQQIDVWSLGVILYLCLSGCFPFEKEPKNLPKLICSGSYSFPQKFWNGVSSNAIELIKRMMTVDPKRRIISAEIRKHAWFQDSSLKSKFEKMLDIKFDIKTDENTPPCKRQRCEM